LPADWQAAASASSPRCAATQTRVLRHLGLPEHDVRPLDESAAAALLTERHPGLAAPVRRRVLAAAQGNPLALLELPLSMTEGQRRAVGSSCGPFPT